MMIRTLAVFTLSALSLYAQASCEKLADAEQNQEQYYSIVNAGLTGSALENQINQVIRTQYRLSYGCLWKVLTEANRDPDNDENILLIYTRKSIPSSHRASGPNQNEPDYWNREHIWSASHGVRNTTAFTDAHHIFPSDRTVNSSRGHKDFDNGGSRHHECVQCRTDADSWEPPDEVKGDVARAMFYVATRYQGDGDSSGTADLRLVDGQTEGGEPTFGVLSTLQEWHCEDPVSEAERQRNDVVHSYQGNRNPYVDHPEWVQRVWDFRCR